MLASAYAQVDQDRKSTALKALQARCCRFLGVCCHPWCLTECAEVVEAPRSRRCRRAAAALLRVLAVLCVTDEYAKALAGVVWHMFCLHGVHPWAGHKSGLVAGMYARVSVLCGQRDVRNAALWQAQSCAFTNPETITWKNHACRAKSGTRGLPPASCARSCSATCLTRWCAGGPQV